MAYTVVGLTVLAGALRFYRLGDWPFAGDELATLAEARSLFTPPSGPVTDQTDRLPRIIPLAYTFHAADYALFGADEFGSRVLMAVFGTLGVAVVYWGLSGPLGERTAAVTALLIAVSPEHVFQSQSNRFYITAWLFASLAVLLGARAVSGGSVIWMVCAGVATVAAVLCHTLTAVLIPGLMVAIAAASWLDRRPIPRRLMGVLVLFGFVVAALLWSLLPLVRGWNAGASWGYNPLRSLLGSVNQIGWPIFLLSLLGAGLALRGRLPQSGYWLACGAMWLGAGLLLPLAVTYHPSYVFALNLGVLVLAGCAVSTVGELLRPLGPGLAWCWVGLAALLPLPSLVSHYRDGSRFDYRTAAGYIAKHWRPGDRVAAVSPGFISYYAGRDGLTLTVEGNPADSLSRAIEARSRLWVVIPSGRDGKPRDLTERLGKTCSQELVVRNTRLDYYDFTVEVYLYQPPPGEP
jgi:hypothetical protein